MIIPAYEAVETLLETKTGLDVHASALVTEQDELVRAKYLILFPATPLITRSRYMASPDVRQQHKYTFRAKAVGLTAKQTMHVADQVVTAVAGAQLALSGGFTLLLEVDDDRSVGSNLIQPDRSVKPWLWYADLVFTGTTLKTS